MTEIQYSLIVLVCILSVIGFTYTAYAVSTLQKQVEDLRKDVLKLRRWYCG